MVPAYAVGCRHNPLIIKERPATEVSVVQVKANLPGPAPRGRVWTPHNTGVQWRQATLWDGDNQSFMCRQFMEINYLQKLQTKSFIFGITPSSQEKSPLAAHLKQAFGVCGVQLVN